jgi:hypothetical protein
MALDCPRDIVGFYQFHALRQTERTVWPQAQSVGLVIWRTIPHGDGAGPPASALRAAWERADGVEKLMTRIRLPMGWLAAAGDDDAGPQAVGFPEGNSRCEVHEQRHRAKHPGCMVDDSDQLTQRGVAPEIENIPQRRMIVTALSHLHKLQTPPKVIHHRLPARAHPPFDRNVLLPPRVDEPILPPGQFRARRGSGLFLRREMDVAAEGHWFQLDGELFAQVAKITVNEMIRQLVGTMNQRILAFDVAYPGIVITQRTDIGVVPPEVRTRCPDIGQETPWMLHMQGLNGRSQHDHVPGRQLAMEDELLHPPKK